MPGQCAAGGVFQTLRKKSYRSDKTELHNIGETVGKVMKSEHF